MAPARGGDLGALVRTERTTARLIGESVADVIQQFRAVRMLIVQDQLNRVRSQVHGSDQPTAIAGETAAC
jgi:hypothetical protein